MLKEVIKQFGCPSAEYAEALQLRYQILRLPLGLEFTIEELQKDEADRHFGLFHDHQIVACLTLTESHGKRMKMRQVAVDKKMQGKGYGQKLAQAAEAYAMKKGFTIMYCNARKTAVPFYEKMGYKIASEEFTEVNIPHYTMEKPIAL